MTTTRTGTGILFHWRSLHADGSQAARAALLGKPVPFPQPRQEPLGNRVYKGSEVELIMLVKHLLYTEKFTIEGARQRIDQYRRTGELRWSARRAFEAERCWSFGRTIDEVLAVLDGRPVPPRAEPPEA